MEDSEQPEAAAFFCADYAALNYLEYYLLLFLDAPVLSQYVPSVPAGGYLQLNKSLASVFQDVAAYDIHLFPVFHVSIHLVGQKHRNVFLSCDGGKVGYLPSELPVDIIDILAFPQFKAIERSEEHTSELQSQFHLVCRLL